jgi:hypothetical protein
MLRKSVLTAVATVGALGLACPSAGPAQAAGAYFTPLGVPSVLSNAIEVKSDKGGGASKSGPQQSPQQFKSAPPVQQQFKAGPQLVPQQAGPQLKKKWIAPGNIPKDVSWTLDRRYRYYGGYFIVPVGSPLYATHPCYDWFYGPYGWGYYWDYDRCPVW